MSIQPKSNLTVDLLKCISDHLSGRKDCRRTEYTVYVGMSDDEHERQLTLAEVSDVSNKVFFYPKRSVFPDVHHRRKSDAVDIINHVIKEHFYDELYDSEDFNSVCIKPNIIEPGVYRYILSFDGKKRQWIRVK